jgi:hypothetical protein
MLKIVETSTTQRSVQGLLDQILRFDPHRRDDRRKPP